MLREQGAPEEEIEAAMHRLMTLRETRAGFTKCSSVLDPPL
jgi:hypothetical protein